VSQELLLSYHYLKVAQQSVHQRKLSFFGEPVDHQSKTILIMVFNLLKLSNIFEAQ
jgi:hypothetical protein